MQIFAYLTQILSQRALQLANVTLQIKAFSSSTTFLFILFLGFKEQYVLVADVGILIAIGAFLTPLFGMGRHIGIKRYFHEFKQEDQISFISTLIILSICTIFMMASVICIIFYNLDFAFVEKNRSLILITILTSLSIALTQPTLNGLVITKHLKWILYSLYFSFTFGICVFIILYLLNLFDLLFCFFIGRLVFEATFSLLNLIGVVKSKIVLPIFKPAYVKHASKFANAMTPEILISQSYFLIERLMFKTFLTAEILGIYILLSNLFGPVYLIIGSIKQGINDDIFFAKTSQEKFEIIQKKFGKFCSLVIFAGASLSLFIIFYVNITNKEKISTLIIFCYLFFLIFKSINQIYHIKLIVLNNNLKIFIFSVIEMPMMIFYIYACSYFTEKIYAIYFLFMVPLTRFLIFLFLPNKR